MKKINILLRGGIGNQLFIYAAFKKFIKINKSYKPFLYDYQVLTTHKEKYFSLDKITKLKIKKNYFLLKIIEKIYIYLKFFFFKKKIDDSCYPKKLKKLSRYKNLTMYGYFQKLYWYKNSYKEIIREIIESFLFRHLENVDSYKIVLSTNYFPNLIKLGNCLNFDYYLLALKKLKIKKQNKILIIGNDGNNYIEKLKTFLKKEGYKNCISYSGIKNKKFNLENSFEKSIFDYLVIAKSKKLISSNSTFCWWAALTREHFNLNSSKVICPRKYTSNHQNNFGNPRNPNLNWIYINNNFFSLY